jgi:hypothetical protein
MPEFWDGIIIGHLLTDLALIDRLGKRSRKFIIRRHIEQSFERRRRSYVQR